MFVSDAIIGHPLNLAAFIEVNQNVVVHEDGMGWDHDVMTVALKIRQPQGAWLSRVSMGTTTWASKTWAFPSDTEHSENPFTHWHPIQAIR